MALYFNYYFGIEKIGVSLETNIFILAFCEFLAMSIADKFIEIPNPYSIIKYCLGISGIICISFYVVN